MARAPAASDTTRAETWALRLALAVPWLFVWHGIDLTDHGFAASNYQLFFAHPEALGPFQHMWLTNALGALGDAALGSLGLLGTRVCWAAALSLCAYLSFRMLRPLCTPSSAAFGALFASVLLVHRCETWLDYNTVTSVAYLACAASLLRGLRSGRTFDFVLAGFVCGASVFARLPNVLMLALGSAPLLAAWIEPQQRAVWRRLSAFALGALLAAAVLIAIMLALGHFSLYVAGVRSLLSSEAGTAVTHGSSRLLGRLVAEQPMALAIGAGIAVVALLGARIARLPGLVAIALLLAVASLAASELRNSIVWSEAVTGLGYALLGARVLGIALPDSLRRGEDPALDVSARVASWLALLSLALAPLGSANGIRNAYVGAWLALALVLAQLLDAARAHKSRSRVLAAALVAAFGFDAAHHAMTYTYRDRPKLALTATVHDPMLRAQLTSPARARVLEGALSALRERVAPGDLLFAYEGTALFHYLTRTRPYADRTWPMLEAPAVLGAALDRAAARHRCVPVVLRARATTSSFDWPRAKKRKRRMAALDKQNRPVVDRFLRRFGYEVRWRNDYFEILEPVPQKLRGLGPPPCR